MPLTFAERRRITLPPWLKGVLIASGVLVLAAAVLEFTADFSSTADTMRAEFEKKNVKLTFSGQMDSSAFPPTLSIAKADVELAGFRLSGTRMELSFPFSAIFGGSEAEIIRFHGGELSRIVSDTPAAYVEIPPPPAPLVLHDIRVPAIEKSGSSNASKLTLEIEPETPGGTASPVVMNVSGSVNGVDWKATIRLNRWLTKEAAEFQAEFNESETTATAKGRIQQMEAGWKMDAETSIKATKLWKSLGGLSAFWASDGMADLPQGAMTANGMLHLENNRFWLENMQLASGDDKAQIQLDLTKAGDVTQGSLALHMEQWSMDGWLPLFNSDTPHGIGTLGRAMMQRSRNELKHEAEAEFFADADALFPKGLALDITIETTKTRLRDVDLAWLNLKADIADGTLTLHQLDAALPANGHASLFGVLKDTQEGWLFSGNTEIKGTSLREVLSWLNLPPTGVADGMLASFQATANLGMDGGGIRLTELEATLDQSRLRGAVIFHWGRGEDASTRVESSWVADRVVLDHYLPPLSWASIGSDDASSANQSVPGWISSFPGTLAMQCRVGEIIWRGLRWKDTTLKGSVSATGMEAESFSARVNDVPLDARIKLTPAVIRPHLEIALKSEASLPVTTIRQWIEGSAPATEETPEESSPEGWSDTVFDTSWMQLMDGSLDLDLAGLKLSDRLETGLLRLKGELNSRAFEISAIQMEAFGGRIAGKGSLRGGALPAIALAFQTEAVSLKKLLLLKLPEVSFDGALQLHGNLTGQGVSPASMVASLKATIGFSVSDLNIQGFDLDSIARRVLVARSATDVSNLARAALEMGSSRIQQLQGNASIIDGMVEFPVTSLTTEAITGELQGRTDLNRMLTNTRLTFTPVTDRESAPPAVHLDIKGPLHAPTRALDTADLEAYIAKQSVGAGN